MSEITASRLGRSGPELPVQPSVSRKLVELGFSSSREAELGGANNEPASPVITEGVDVFLDKSKAMNMKKQNDNSGIKKVNASW